MRAARTVRSVWIGTMRTLPMPRRYERTFPVVMAIVVASAVTVAVAFVVLPSGGGENDGRALNPALPAVAEVGSTPVVPDQGRQPAVASSPAEPTAPIPTPTARGIRRPSPTPS